MTPALQTQLSRTIADALLQDAGYSLPPGRAGNGRSFRGLPLREIGRIVAEAETGRSLDWGDYDVWNIIAKAKPFADALLNFLQEAAVREFERLGDNGTFWLRPRQIERLDGQTEYYLKLSGLSSLQKVGSSGEPEAVLAVESNRTRTANTYANRYILPRQSFVGRDPKYFFDIPTQMALSCRECLDNLIGDAFSENSGLGPTMTEDALPLFDNTRENANYLTGATSALSASSLQAASVLLRAIKTADGKVLKLKPRYLLVPAALEQTALMVRNSVGLGAITVASQMPASESPTATLHPGPLNVVVLPVLDDLSTTGWYLAASSDVQCVELLSLWTPRPTPQVFPVKTDRLALQWSVVLDVGVATPDWRTIVKADGV